MLSGRDKLEKELDTPDLCVCRTLKPDCTEWRGNRCVRRLPTEEAEKFITVKENDIEFLATPIGFKM